MEERERRFRLWCEMWLKQEDLGIRDIFAEDVVYTESWGPKYPDRATVEHWFNEWNTRGKVLAWDIKQFFHKGDQTVVEWYFKSQTETTDHFDGVTIIQWTQDNKIQTLKEFCCNLEQYNPYLEGEQA